MDRMLADISNLRPLIWLYGIVLLAGVASHFVVFRILLHLTKRTIVTFDNALVNRCYRPLQWIVILLIVRVFGKLPNVNSQVPEVAEHVIALLLIALVAWLLIRMAYVLEDYVTSRFDVGVQDNLKARKIHTQFKVLKRIAIVVVGILAFGTMLMTFERVRQSLCITGYERLRPYNGA